MYCLLGFNFRPVDAALTPHQLHSADDALHHAHSHLIASAYVVWRGDAAGRRVARPTILDELIYPDFEHVTSLAVASPAAPLDADPAWMLLPAARPAYDAFGTSPIRHQLATHLVHELLTAPVWKRPNFEAIFAKRRAQYTQWRAAVRARFGV